MRYILDASAVVAFFREEDGVDVVDKLLTESGEDCVIHPANWIEVHYIMRKRAGLDEADSAIRTLQRFGVSKMDVPGDDFLLRVAEIKFAYSYLSLGDSYAVALSERLNGTVVTSDKPFANARDITRIRLIR